MIDVKLLQEDKYCIWPKEKHHKNILHYSSLLDSRQYQSIVLYVLIILVFNFSDIKLSFVKIIYHLPYTPEKTHYNVKNMPLIHGVVCCGLGLVGHSVPKCPLFSPSPTLSAA